MRSKRTQASRLAAGLLCRRADCRWPLHRRFCPSTSRSLLTSVSASRPKLAVAHVDGLTTRERLQGIRKLARLRHACPIDQDRDDTECRGQAPPRFRSQRSRPDGRAVAARLRPSHVSQLGPMTTSMTSHAATWLFRCATKSTPTGMLSTSIKRLLRPNAGASRSCSRPATPVNLLGGN